VEYFDVVIVGAGPAGLKCAETLGGSNLKVLIVDKKKVIGPKVCGGLMTTRGIRYINHDVGENKFDRFIVHSKSREVSIDISKSPLYTINRKDLGQFQVCRIKQYPNITLRSGTYVSEIGKGSILANGRKISYKYLVGADGSSSIVRKFLGIDSKSVGIGMHYIVKTDHYKDIELFFDSKFFNAWYAWISPHDDFVSIGTGGDPKIISGKRLLSNFHKWLDIKGVNISNAEFESQSLNYDYRGICFGNIFLIGDAAGLISGFTGEGIYPAMVSGEEVAKKILVSEYKINLDEILKKKKQQDLLSNTLVIMKFLRPLGHEMITFILKSKLFRKIAIDIFA